MLELAVVDDAAAAEVMLDPVRASLLAALAEPGSATSVGAAEGLSRQQTNYHLKTLERHGLIELVEERRKGNCTERIMQATASSYVISPAALAAVAPDPDRAPDQLSAYWLLALAARMIGEVGTLIAGATAKNQPLATYAVDSEIRFASATERAAFATELSVALAQLVAKYHRPDAKAGREHRFIAGLHPSLTHPAGLPSVAPTGPNRKSTDRAPGAVESEES